MRRYIAPGVVIALAVGACSTAAQTVAPTQVLPASIAASAAPTTPVTVPPASAATVTPTSQPTCIISRPQQLGTDMTPVVIQYEGITESDCQKYLALTANATEFEKEHPPTRLSEAPNDKPKCTKALANVTVTVWGTGAADFLCTALQLASPQP